MLAAVTGLADDGFATFSPCGTFVRDRRIGERSSGAPRSPSARTGRRSPLELAARADAARCSDGATLGEIRAKKRSDLEFSGDGKLIASAARRVGGADVWDVATRRRVTSVDAVQQFSADFAVALSSDGSMLALGGDGGTSPRTILRIVDVRTGGAPPGAGPDRRGSRRPRVQPGRSTPRRQRSGGERGVALGRRQRDPDRREAQHRQPRGGLPTSLVTGAVC